MIATFYYEKTRDQSISADERRDYIARGLEAEDRALQINPDYVEALVYKNILLRTKALTEPDPAVKEALIREADALRIGAGAAQGRRRRADRGGHRRHTRSAAASATAAPGRNRRPDQWVYADTDFTAAGQSPVRTEDVRPIYAPMVIASGVKGQVVVEATVDPRGKVAQLRVVKTQPMLTQATIDAVRQWEFDPATVAAGGSLITVTANFTPPSR